MLAHIVDAFERRRVYAGCFTGPATLPLLEWLQRTTYGNAEMERRRQLLIRHQLTCIKPHTAQAHARSGS